MTDTQNNQIIGESLFLFSAWWQLKRRPRSRKPVFTPTRAQALRTSDCQRHTNSSSDGICIRWDSTDLTTTQSHVNKQTGTRLNTNKPTKTPSTLGNTEEGAKKEGVRKVLTWYPRAGERAGEAEPLSRRSLEAGPVARASEGKSVQCRTRSRP